MKKGGEAFEIHTKDFNFTMPEVQEFTNPKEDDITEKSIPVGCTMIPSKLTNNGILIGTENHSIKGYDLNKTREEILYTMQSESAFDTLGILAASDDYMIFCEIIDSKNYKYYAYEFSSKKTSLIKESKDLSALVTDEAIIHKDKAYLFLCDKTNDEQEYTYNGYIYDFKTGELDLFENEKLASFPAMLND